MIKVEVQNLEQNIARLHRLGRGKVVDKALVRAINHTARKARTHSSKKIREDVVLPAAIVKKTIDLRPANIQRQEAYCNPPGN